MYSTPPSSQSAISSSLIAREALERSVSPAQKRSNPPPVPEMPTVTLAPPSALKSSAAFVTNGPTVLEPSAVMTPPPSPLLSSSPPQPAARGTRASAAITAANVMSA